MTGNDYSAAVLLGNQISPSDLEIIGDVVIEGASSNQKLFLEGLDLENVDISGDIRIRNVVFSGDLNLFQARLAGQNLVFENLIINGNFAPPANFLEMSEDERKTVVLRNISWTKDLQLSTP
jgi:hypothetical protein